MQTQEAPPAKPRKPRKAKPTQVELRLLSGATVMKTVSDEGCHGVFYTFTDTGGNARADVVERLIEAGKLCPRGDGLFADDSQTWGMA